MMFYYIYIIFFISINFILVYIKKIVICYLFFVNKNMFVFICRYIVSMYNDIIIV